MKYFFPFRSDLEGADIGVLGMMRGGGNRSIRGKPVDLGWASTTLSHARTGNRSRIEAVISERHIGAIQGQCSLYDQVVYNRDKYRQLIDVHNKKRRRQTYVNQKIDADIKQMFTTKLCNELKNWYNQIHIKPPTQKGKTGK